MRKSCVVFPIFALILLLVSPVYCADKAVFGIAIPLTGPYAAMAEDMKKGGELALEEINAAGGVLGQPAELVVRDSQLKGDVALRRYKEMSGSGIKFIGGSLSGAISLVANEFACKNDLLYMSYCHNSLPLGKEFCGNGFAVAIPYMSASALAKFAFNKLGKKWMALTADYRWGHDNLAAWLVNSDKYGGQFIGNIYHPLGTRDYSAYIPQILSAKPDFLVMTNFGTDQTSAIKQLAELGLTNKIPIVLSKAHIFSIKEIGSAFNKNCYGAVTFSYKLADKYPQAKKFVEVWEAKYGSPPSQDGECAYVATKALFQAMNKAGTTTDVDKVIKTLAGMKIETPKGETEYRACDHVRVQSICVIQGKGEEAKGWDLVNLIEEVPASDILESCENNAKDVPYGAVKLPGK